MMSVNMVSKDLTRSTVFRLNAVPPYNLVLKEEDYSPNRRGKREYMNKEKNSDFIRKLNKHFTSIVEVPRMRIGERQEIETLINEEAFLFARYLRDEKPTWNPRIVALS